MGQVNKVMALPADVRQELDAKLRAAAYGNLVEISEWITGKAYPISKSGLHRYAAGLKATDAARGDAEAQLLTAITNQHQQADNIRGRKATLLMRLGLLEVERAKLLTELAPMLIGSDSGTVPI